MKGVVSTSVGYTGGRSDKPTYSSVCSGTTGHAEAVEVVFDPHKISYDHILDVFFHLHNPTQDRSFHGGQYRSAIFFHSPEQESTAKASRDKWQRALSKPVATQVVAADTFWMAEEYHQDYYKKHSFMFCTK